jgi:hypothetical protein
MGRWDEKAGRVSQAFDDWVLIDRDQRSFLKLGAEFATVEYTRIWTESGEEPGDGEGPEQIDLFEARVDGLHQHDFEWMHFSGVLRDAVTNFEVYLEKGREEILRHQGDPITVGERSPSWPEAKRFYGGTGAEIDGAEVEAVRDLRHFLAPRRGELRTEAQREKFAAEAEDSGFGPINAELSAGKVIAAMDELGAGVRAVDVRVYELTWGGEKLAG